MPRVTNGPPFLTPAGGTLPPTFTQKRRTNTTRSTSNLPTSLRKHQGISAPTATIPKTAAAAEQDQRPPSTVFKTRSLPLPANYKGPPANSRVSSSVRHPPRKRPRTSLSILRNGTVSEVQAGTSTLLPRAWTTSSAGSLQGSNGGGLAGDTNSGKEWARSGSAVTSRPHTYGVFLKVGGIIGRGGVERLIRSWSVSFLSCSNLILKHGTSRDVLQ